MTTYLLDFTATPLKPAAGGQLHIVVVGGERGHDSVEAAIADLVLSHELEGTTASFCPLARVRVTDISGQGSYIEKVQVSAPNEAPDYDPDPVKPTAAEVLAAFPNATDIRVCAGTGFRRFNLALAAYQLAPRDDGQCLVITLYDGLQTGQFITNDWVDGVRQNVRRNIESLGASAKKNALAAAALAAALGDAQ